MGVVYETHHLFTRRTVALKLLSEELRETTEARQRLLREAHALTSVRHPAFVEVLDAGVCSQHGPYVVLEMLEGRTLDGILAGRRQLAVSDTVQIGHKVCAGLAFAHARGVIHRDLKPSNIFVAQDSLGEIIKVIDLGVAAVESDGSADRKVTSAHAVLGTPEYMAPEQLLGHAIDARTDVYAVGISLFECLTGEVPYPGTYPQVLIQVSQATHPPDVRARRPDVAPALAAVIERALQKDAGARFPSAAQLGSALLAASGLAPGPSALLGVTSVARAPEAPAQEVPAPSGDRPSYDRPSDYGEPAIVLVKKKTPSSPAPGAGYKRQFVRVPYVTPLVFITPSGNAIEARSEEISEEGMLLLSPLPYPVGTAIRVRFAAPVSGEMFTMDGTVRWVREGRGRTAMGVEFRDVPAALRRTVIDYVSTMTAAVP
jgi:serine/threonine-protein kinase